MSLNPDQWEAANHVEGPLLVLAGAGSGKTRVVTCRIAKLIENGVNPSEILAVTFTNKAAQEMRHRIRAETHAQILATTFHSLGARILREAITPLGYRNDFAIYDEEDSEKLLKSCLKDQKELFKQMRSQISAAKNRVEEPENAEDALFGQIYALYQAKLRECNALDFDDLLYLTVKLLQQNEAARTLFQNRWRFVLIDEYQDTNHAQYLIAKTLVEKHRNICAVGDPDQSIYSWRGACYHNILNFEKDFPGAKVVTLDQNYRSTNTILQAANHLISHNPTRFEKRLWSAKGEGSKIQVIIEQNERKEAEHVVQKIAMIGKSASYQDIAIFYRTNAQSRAFEDEFLRRRIPYTIIGGISFYQRREVKDILAYLRVVVSDDDLISFLRTINLPKRGLGAATLEKIVEGAAIRKEPILSFCRSFDFKLSPKQRDGLVSYLSLISRIREKSRNCQIYELISDIISESRYLDFLREDPETEEERKQNLEELIGKAAEWEQDTENPTLFKFLEELALHTSAEEKIDTPSVNMMTLHNSKGLEFLVVFLVGMEEELFPHANSFGKPEALEEERRLCYVGMTRAKQQLTLSASLYRNTWTGPRSMRPSRFFGEIPKNFLIAQRREEPYSLR